MGYFIPQQGIVGRIFEYDHGRSVQRFVGVGELGETSKIQEQTEPLFYRRHELIAMENSRFTTSTELPLRAKDTQNASRCQNSCYCQSNQPWAIFKNVRTFRSFPHEIMQSCWLFLQIFCVICSLVSLHRHQQDFLDHYTPSTMKSDIGSDKKIKEFSTISYPLPETRFKRINQLF